MDTVLVSSMEFRNKQREYLEKVDDGQINLFLKRKKSFYAIVPTDLSLTINPETVKRLNQADLQKII